MGQVALAPSATVLRPVGGSSTSWSTPTTPTSSMQPLRTPGFGSRPMPVGPGSNQAAGSRRGPRSCWPRGSPSISQAATRLPSTATTPTTCSMRPSFDDGRQGASLGGLWVSLEGGAFWLHPRLLNTSGALCQPTSDEADPTFVSGQGFVLTSCGIEHAETTSLATWAPLPAPPFSVDGLADNSWGDTLVACSTDPSGQVRVWSSTDLGAKASSWSEWPAALPAGSCTDIVAAPGEGLLPRPGPRNGRP